MMIPSTANSARYQLFVGIDIAPTTATAAWIPATSPTSPTSTASPLSKPLSKPFTFDQTPQGYAALHNKLQATGCLPQQTLVLMEATSTYWIMLAVELHEAGYAVSVVNPAQAHHFARAQLKRAKTDELDAQTLPHLAHSLSPAPWTPPPPIYYELAQCLSQRDTLQSLRTQSLNRLHALAHRRVVIASVPTWG